MPRDPRPTLFDHAGGLPAIEALAAAHHRRCLADPELNHPFSHADANPQHIPRLAAYWAEVLGGPITYSATLSTQSATLRMHAGNGDMTDLGERFLTCFVAAMDDAGLPDDAPFRHAMRSYMRWAVEDVLSFVEPQDVAEGISMPRWGWDGLMTRR